MPSKALKALLGDIWHFKPFMPPIGPHTMLISKHLPVQTWTSKNLSHVTFVSTGAAHITAEPYDYDEPCNLLASSVSKSAAQAAFAAAQPAVVIGFLRQFVLGGAPVAATIEANERIEEQAEQFVDRACLIREVFNPFQTVAVNTSWRTPGAVTLAQAMYDERRFDRMTALADALQQAGCQEADILNHCRQPGEHVKGCWVVDGVLGWE